MNTAAKTLFKVNNEISRTTWKVSSVTLLSLLTISGKSSLYIPPGNTRWNTTWKYHFVGLALKGLIGLSISNISNKDITLMRWVCLHVTVKAQEQS